MADSSYNLWLASGASASALIALATEFVEEPDDAAYLTEVQGLYVGMSPIEIALASAWCANFAARALVDCFDGDVDAAREELQRVALSIAETATAEES